MQKKIEFKEKMKYSVLKLKQYTLISKTLLEIGLNSLINLRMFYFILRQYAETFRKVLEIDLDPPIDLFRFTINKKLISGIAPRLNGRYGIDTSQQPLHGDVEVSYSLVFYSMIRQNSQIKKQFKCRLAKSIKDSFNIYQNLQFNKGRNSILYEKIRWFLSKTLEND